MVSRPHRAVSPVTIRNRGVDPLLVERLLLPVPNLTLHADPEGHLWSQEVLLVRREGQESAERHLGKAGPGPALSTPRAQPEASAVTRVFNSVFG